MPDRDDADPVTCLRFVVVRILIAEEPECLASELARRIDPAGEALAKHGLSDRSAPAELVNLWFLTLRVWLDSAPNDKRHLARAALKAVNELIDHHFKRETLMAKAEGRRPYWLDDLGEEEA